MEIINGLQERERERKTGLTTKAPLNYYKIAV